MKPHEHVILEIARERERQMSAEGWTANHDDRHRNGELGTAAACYASPERMFKTRVVAGRGYEPATLYVDAWPWEDRWWKPKDRRSDLVRAAALIVAEIERVDRAAASKVA